MALSMCRVLCSSLFSSLAASSTLLPSSSLYSKQAKFLSGTRWNSNAVASEADTDDKPSFSSLGLSASLVNDLSRNGYTTPFDIQAKTLPHTLEGKNIIGRAVTGSGKTLAYALPIINKLSSSKARGVPRALILTPTRELCRQVTECISSLSSSLRCVSLYGGASYSSQERELRYGADVVCATPGRLNDQINRGNLPLDNFQIVILDEADELLTPNFKIQIDDVLADTPSNKQMLLFSATMPPNVKDVIRQYMKQSVVVDLTASSNRLPPAIKHKVLKLDSGMDRFGTILDLINVHSPQRAIVFTTTKMQASDLGSFLSRNGVSATSLHGDLSQQMRESCLERFRSGRIKVIAATDVAARGIDIPEIDFVLQIEPPPSGIDSYIHRSGRTGRKGLPGTSILLLSSSYDSQYFLRELKRVVPVEEIKRPSRDEVITRSLDSAVKSIEAEKDEKLINAALPLAEDMISRDGAKALASAIISICGIRVYDRPESRSRSSREESRSRDFDSRSRSNFRDRRGGRREFSDSGWNNEWSGRRGSGRQRDDGFSGRSRRNRGSFGINMDDDWGEDNVGTVEDEWWDKGSRKGRRF